MLEQHVQGPGSCFLILHAPQRQEACLQSLVDCPAKAPARAAEPGSADTPPQDRAVQPQLQCSSWASVLRLQQSSLTCWRSFRAEQVCRGGTSTGLISSDLPCVGK